MRSTRRRGWLPALILAGAVLLLPAPLIAHAGSGIVVDRLGQVYFVDMVSGIWKIDTHGTLTHIAGPAFHWLTLDAADRFSTVRLPTGSGGDIARMGVNPTLLLGSDGPLTIGSDGNLYYPSRGGTPVQILSLLSSGKTGSVATLPATTSRGPLRDLNGLAAGADGSLYYTENDAIRRISKEGRVSTVVQDISLARCASTPAKTAEGGPLLRGLAIDAGGTIYVAASGGCGTVLEVTPAGQVTILFSVPRPWSPTGIALFGTDVYVLEFLHAESDDRREMLPRVRRIAANGTTTVIATVTRH